MNHKKPGGTLLIQFIGVVVLPLVASWLLGGGVFQGQKIGICLGAAILGNLQTRRTPIK